MNEIILLNKEDNERLEEIGERIKTIGGVLKEAAKSIEIVVRNFYKDKCIVGLAIIILLMVIAVAVVGIIKKNKKTKNEPTIPTNSTTTDKNNTTNATQAKSLFNQFNQLTVTEEHHMINRKLETFEGLVDFG